MKFLDSFKMALHNLWNSKSRTLLTVIIVLVVSSLIMAMCLMGTNFLENNDRGFRLQFEASGTQYYLWNKKAYSHSSNVQDPLSRYFEYTEVDAIGQKSVEYADVVDSFSYQIRYRNYPSFSVGGREHMIILSHTDFRFPMSVQTGAVVEGRIWTPDDEGKNNIWLNEDFVHEVAQSGYELLTGSEIVLVMSGQTGESDYGSPPPSDAQDVTFRVQGIYKVPESNSYYRNDAHAVISGAFVADTLNFGADTLVESVSVRYSPVAGSFDYTEIEKRMKAYVSEVNEITGSYFNEYTKKFEARFVSSFLDDAVMQKVIGYLIMGILCVLAFLILLLSIGSVANTIIISVDKNKKFIGLMKAMGLNNKHMKGIVYKEATVQIFIGVGLGTLILYLAKNLLLKLMDQMIGSMFAVDMAITFSISPFVPLVTFLAFLGMAILFSKGALNRIGKMDVISIISEVA